MILSKQSIQLIRNIFPKLTGTQPMTGTGGHSMFFTMQSQHKDPNITKFHQRYKFSRAKWYVIEFDVKNYTAVVHWCTQQFGAHPKYPDAWSRWWHRYETSIHFANEDDAILFKLTWGENASTE